jgi:hypothetical protein
LCNYLNAISQSRNWFPFCAEDWGWWLESDNDFTMALHYSDPMQNMTLKDMQSFLQFTRKEMVLVKI